MSISYDLWKWHCQLCFYCRLPTFLSSRHRMINYRIFVSTVKIRSTIIRPTFSSRRSPITNDCLLNLSSDFLLMTLSTYLHQITYSTYINYFFGIGIAPDSIFLPCSAAFSQSHSFRNTATSRSNIQNWGLSTKAGTRKWIRNLGGANVIMVLLAMPYGRLWL